MIELILILYDFSIILKIIQFFVFNVNDMAIFENIALKNHYKIYQPLFIICFFEFKIDFDLFF